MSSRFLVLGGRQIRGAHAERILGSEVCEGKSDTGTSAPRHRGKEGAETSSGAGFRPRPAERRRILCSREGQRGVLAPKTPSLEATAA